MPLSFRLSTILMVLLAASCGTDTPVAGGESASTATTRPAASSSTSTTRDTTTTSEQVASTTTSLAPASPGSLVAFRVQDDSFIRHVLVLDVEANEIVSTGITSSADDQKSNRGAPQVTEEGMIFDPVTLQVFDPGSGEVTELADSHDWEPPQSGGGINRSNEGFINYSGFDKSGEGTVYFEGYTDGENPYMSQSLPSLISGLDPQPVAGSNGCYTSYEWQGSGDFCTLDNQNGGAKIVATSLEADFPSHEALELCSGSYGYWGRDLFFDGYFGGDTELSGVSFSADGVTECETWLPQPPTGADITGVTWDDKPIVSNVNDSGTTDYYVVESPSSEPRLITDFDLSELG